MKLFKSMKQAGVNAKVFKFLEISIVIMLIITVMITGQEVMYSLLIHTLNQDLLENYKLILSEILFLAIGIEMAYLIIKQDVYYVLDVLILAIARKVITFEVSSDLLISVICIIALLLARKFCGPKSCPSR